MFFPISYASFKGWNHFGVKHAPTGKFAVHGLIGVVNWLFKYSLQRKCCELGVMKILKLKRISMCQVELK